MDTHELQIVILSGQADSQRAVFGLAAALAAAASGTTVTVVLSMHGAMWAAPFTGLEPTVHDFKPISDLMADLIDMGGKIEACASCVDNYCPSEVGPDGRKKMREGIERVGLGVVSMRMSHVPTVVC